MGQETSEMETEKKLRETRDKQGVYKKNVQVLNFTNLDLKIGF